LPILSRVMILVLSIRSHAGSVHAVTLEATGEPGTVPFVPKHELRKLELNLTVW
jgi:hypothetical protein